MKTLIWIELLFTSSACMAGLDPSVVVNCVIRDFNSSTVSMTCNKDIPVVLARKHVSQEKLRPNGIVHFYSTAQELKQLRNRTPAQAKIPLEGL